MRGDQIDMDEFLAFALRCLDDDERVARSASTFPYGLPMEVPWARAGQIATAKHIARWDPQQALRLTSALRHLIDEYSHEGRETTMLIELVTALYEGRPGWREEWAS